MNNEMNKEINKEEALQLITNALNTAVLKGTFNMSDISAILVALNTLNKSIMPQKTGPDPKFEPVEKEYEVSETKDSAMPNNTRK